MYDLPYALFIFNNLEYNCKNRDQELISIDF